MRIKFRLPIIVLLVVLVTGLVFSWPQRTQAFSLVPASCQDEDGCNICESVKIFTNAADIIGVVLSSVALLMFVLGGFMLIFSGGQPERVEHGKKILIGTVTGLGVVFLAWFAVNVIVRLSATAGAQSKTPTKIFSQDWWNFNSCLPPLPTTCAGLSVGELCGTGECTAKSKSGACSCYRPISPEGDSSVCSGDATSPDTANSKDKKCYCSTQCTRYAKKTKKDYICMTSTQAKGHTVATGISCADPAKVCALNK